MRREITDHASLCGSTSGRRFLRSWRRVQLQQVNNDLLMNGIQAMKPVTTASPTIDSIARARSIRRCCGRDSGIGIEPENADRLFNASSRRNGRHGHRAIDLPVDYRAA